MQVTEHMGDGDPDTGATSSSAPGPRQSDNPPVGEPLVVSRRNPAARPSVAAIPDRRATAVPTDPGEGDAETAPPEEPDPLPMSGQVVLVTAAGSDIGAAVARELERRGAGVLLLDGDPTAIIATLDSMPQGRAVPLLCDTASERDLSSVVEFVRRATALDAIVHVIARSAETAEVSTASSDLERQLQTLVLGPVRMVEELGESLSDAAPLVLVRDPDARSGVERVAPDLVREQVGARCRVWDVEVDTELASDRFAEVLADLLSWDDIDVDRVALAAPIVEGTDSGRESGTGR